MVEEEVKDHANSNKPAGNGNKVHAPFSTITTKEIQIMEVITKEVEVVGVAAEEEAISKENINKEIKIISNKEDGETTITTTTTITYQINITPKEEWEEEATKTTKIITTKAIAISLIKLTFRNRRIIHRTV